MTTNHFSSHTLANGLQILIQEMPTPKALRAVGAAWQPYRSVAAWYLWRVTDTP